MLNRLLLAAVVVSALLTGTAPANQHVVVVLDDSGSMADNMRGRSESKMEAAKKALITVLEQLPEDTVVGVLLLNGRVNGQPWVIPLGPIDKQGMRSAIQGIRTRSGTPLGKFMKIGADALLELRDERHYGTYRLLIVTDGEASDKRLVERYLPDILSRGISVDVIGVAMRGDHSLATKVHSYRRADDPDTLTQALSEVFAETSGNDQDTAGVSDFEFLAGFPDEVAAAALVALSETDNQPIGESRPPVVHATPSHRPPTAQTPTPTQATPPEATERGRGNLFWKVLVIFVVLYVAKGLFSGRARQRR
jgi:hypothetical protein